MTPSLAGNPRTRRLADRRQQREQHADYDQLNAASARDASSRREQKSQNSTSRGDRLNRYVKHRLPP
jgi:hypothetical protein